MSTMRCYLSVTVVAVVASTILAQDVVQRLDSISAASLNSRDVIGSLGLPLGQVTEISATVVSGDSTRRKADSGTYLLRVLTVNGKKVQEPPLMLFNVDPRSHAQLANDRFSLYELKKGEKTGRLDSASIKELEVGYVDSKVKLSVYETGGYAGIAGTNKFGDAGTAFSFRTSLEILEQLDPP